MYDTIIIGGGPAGLAAGIYAARFGLKTVIFDSGIPISQLSEASSVENYPGFKEISGAQLWEKMKEHARLYLEIIPDAILDIKKQGDLFVLTSAENKKYKAKGVIFAMGAAHKKLGVKGEKEFAGRGVSYCAVCDAPFFKDKIVGVVGGENPALWDALYLAEHASMVYLIHDQDVLKADKILQERAKSQNNIEVLPGKAVKEIKGEVMVSGVILEDSEKEKSELKLDGLFIAYGSAPNIELAKKSGVGVDDDGYIITDKAQKANVDGIFAAGDITGGLKQIVTACSEGAVAANSAYNYVKGKVEIIIDKEKCTGCGMCVSACPEGVYELKEGVVEITGSEKCIHCLKCVHACPENAITIK